MTKSLQTKLFESGAIEENDLERIQQIKNEHRRAYQKSYQAAYKLKKKRVSVLLTDAQHQRLEQSASDRHMSRSEYLCHLFENAENETYVGLVPTEVQALDIRIIRLRNVINSIVPQVKESSEVTLVDIERILQEFSSLRQEVRLLSAQKNLLRWLKEQSSKDPLFIPKLLEAISEFVKPAS